MSEPFIAEVKIFAGNFAPRGWVFCNGQLLQISQNTALFSLLGTTYGGDGRQTFGVPDLQGRMAVHPGTGPGLSQRRLGETGGSETVTLTTQQLAAHTHDLGAKDGPATELEPAGAALADGSDSYGLGAANQTMGAMIQAGAAAQPHNNQQPYLVVNYIIATEGVYPSRS